jgi:hypothetical protein
MTHFEAYQWEDHVPRAGSWKFNLAAGLLALGLIFAAFPDSPGNATAATAAAAPAGGMVQPVKGSWAYCPVAATAYADS